MKLKKPLSLLLVVCLMAVFAVGCSEDTGNDTANNNNDDAQQQEETAGGALKTGLAVKAYASHYSDATADADGNAEGDSVVAAVLVDADGKLVDVKLDTMQAKVAIGADGTIKTAADATFLTKQELKEDYNMKKASGIGKEWYEQANALTDYVIGKTADEISGIAVDEEGKPTSEDLTASVTVDISDYLEVITTAMNNATEMGAQEGDTLGLGVYTVLSDSSAAATAEGDGNAQTDTTFAAVTKDADGVITSCLLDCVQAKIAFSTAGAITTEDGTAFKTKMELGDEYNMKKASAIGKEWYEQTEAFMEYVTGKTLDEVTGIAVDEESKPTDEDLKASCSMAIAKFTGAIQKAMA